MSKKKLLKSCVVFSLLLPFSCGITTPFLEGDMAKQAYATTTAFSQYGGGENDIFAVEDQSLQRSSQVVVSKVALNVRAYPSTSSKVVGLLNVGDSAPLISTQNGWHKISFGGETAYVSASVAYSKVENTSSSSKVVESFVSLNVRASASRFARVVGSLSKGETATYVGTSGNWHSILFEGSICFVYASSSYCKVVEVATETPNPQPEISPEEESLADGKLVKITSSALNIRSAPTTSSQILGVGKNLETFEYYSTNNGWHKISYEGGIAYVSADYSTIFSTQTQPETDGEDVVGATLVVAKVDSLCVRSGPSTGYPIVGTLDKGDMAIFASQQNDWYQTVYKGQIAYISQNPALSSKVTFLSSTKSVEQAIGFGSTLLGTPYVYGATRYLNYDGSKNPYFSGKSFDCSSFTQYIFAETIGVKIGSTSREQSLDGEYVAKGDIERGDLLFFTNSDRYHLSGLNRIGHVAIYLGNNYILHTASDHAVIEEISSTRWKYYITARDVICE